MKIGILTYLIDEKSAGIGRYTYNLVKNLLKFNGKNEFFLIHYKKDNSDIYQQGAYEIIIPLTCLPHKKIIWTDIILPLKLQKCGLDILHDPYEFAPYFFNVLDSKKILTLHDITPKLLPETHMKITQVRCKYELPRILNNADRIITVSNSSKRDILFYYKIKPEKVSVVYNGVGDSFKPQEDCANIKEKYNIKFPFFLFVGTLEPRKNIPTLIKAYKKLRKHRFIHKLVIVGRKGWNYANIPQIIKDLSLENDVLLLDNVPEDDLPSFYSLADLFIYPSLYEGFGLPPLEAMACGTPVITSNTSSLPEVVGDAGIMVDPDDVDGLARAMHEVLTNDGLREEMIKKGLERAKLFSWENTARETLKVYEG